MSSVFRVGFAAALAFLVAGAFFTPQVPAPGDAPFSAAAHAPSRDTVRPAVEPAGDGADPSGLSDGFTDLYGNEINDAIATYTFDPSGSLYELHSPQTEIPRLGSPKS